MIIMCPYDVDRVLYRTLVSRGAKQIMLGDVDRFQFNDSGVNNDLYNFIQYLFGFEVSVKTAMTSIMEKYQNSLFSSQ